MSLDADIKVTQYMIELPKRELLEQKLHKTVEMARLEARIENETVSEI